VEWGGVGIGIKLVRDLLANAVFYKRVVTCVSAILNKNDLDVDIAVALTFFVPRRSGFFGDSRRKPFLDCTGIGAVFPSLEPEKLMSKNQNMHK
jgi:hypothetical protein